MSAVVLYGPPTAGKDTITTALAAAHQRFRLVTKLKQGSGRTTGYRFVTAAELEGLRARGRIVVETHRYGNVYAVDRQDLDDMRVHGLVPVVHIGNVTDMRALVTGCPANWIKVLLWVSRDVCAERSRVRRDADAPARLTAWDETVADLLGADLAGLFHLVLRTDELGIPEAVQTIGDAVRSPAPPSPRTREEVLHTLALPTQSA